MRIAFAIILILHGIAHMPGFLASRPGATVKGLPYKTTILGGHLDVGDAGIQFLGLMWVVMAIAFVAAGAAMILDVEWWPVAVVCVAVASLILSLLNVPEARIGVVVNVAILTLLAVSGSTGWFNIYQH